jgi:hypothetical protein
MIVALGRTQKIRFFVFNSDNTRQYSQHGCIRETPEPLTGSGHIFLCHPLICSGVAFFCVVLSLVRVLRFVNQSCWLSPVASPGASQPTRKGKICQQKT